MLAVYIIRTLVVVVFCLVWTIVCFDSGRQGTIVIAILWMLGEDTKSLMKNNRCTRQGIPIYLCGVVITQRVRWYFINHESSRAFGTRTGDNEIAVHERVLTKVEDDYERYDNAW